ncbi:MAG: RNA polymerase sigma-70 factor [Flavitalea sp.]
MNQSNPGNTNPVVITVLQQNIHHNSQDALRELYTIYLPRLLKFALQYVRTKEVAEELVNDVMVNIWNHRHTIHEIRDLETYLFVAVRNKALNYLESYSNYQVRMIEGDEQARVINVNDPAKELEWKEIAFELEKAIDTLPSQCRTVFKLIREDGFKYKQVAEILNLSPRTVETQLFRAIKKLDKILQSHHAVSKSRSIRAKIEV